MRRVNVHGGLQQCDEQNFATFRRPWTRSIPLAVNDPTLLPALASVVFFRISGYSALKVTEQARLRSQLEGAVAVSLVDVPEDCRILLDAPDGMAVAVLHNPEAALDIAERCAAVAEVSIPLAIGINHGAIQVTPDESSHPGLAGDAIGVAASIADFAGPQRVTASRAFANALLQANPLRARSLRKVSTYTDWQLRTHELLTPNPGAAATRRKLLSFGLGTLVVGLVGSAIGFRIAQRRSGMQIEPIWKTFGKRSHALWRHYNPDDGEN